jgi:NAD(P)H-hydrate epimerase
MKKIPSIAADKLPWLTTAQMIEVDCLMEQYYHIELKQMMENAGRSLARLAVERFFRQSGKRKKVRILAGSGGNGGGALVAARRLSGWGFKVEVYLSKTVEKLSPVTFQQYQIIQKIGVNVHSGDDLLQASPCDLVIDGMIGYRLSGDPQGLTVKMILWANDQPAPIIALDTPSGLDLTTGTFSGPVIKADATLTLALPKVGLRLNTAKAVVGDLFLADIGVPPSLYDALDLGKRVKDNLFKESDILKIKPYKST